MIDFTMYGLLPTGIHETDLLSLKKNFVDEMVLSATRPIIYGNYETYLSELRALTAHGFTQWVNGSFVTTKRNPNDMDVITFVDYRDYEQNPKQFDALSKWRYQQPKTVDAYLVKVYPENHERRKFYEFDKIEWQHLFTQVRKSKEKKGFLELTF